MSLNELLHEFTTDPIAQYVTPTQNPQPIYREDSVCVGFYCPKYRHKRYGMGLIYIGKQYRGHGYATHAAKMFYDEHPDMTWYADSENIISQHIAQKIGLHKTMCMAHISIVYRQYHK